MADGRQRKISLADVYKRNLIAEIRIRKSLEEAKSATMVKAQTEAYFGMKKKFDQDMKKTWEVAAKKLTRIERKL